MGKRNAVVQKASLVWRDGQPYSVDFEDVYFSSENGLEESRITFIDGNDLIARWKALPRTFSSAFVIAETGFGCALNFLLTWSLWEKHAPPNATLHYISCENFPLSRVDLQRSFALWPELSKYAQQLLTQYPVLTPGFHTITFKESRVKLTLLLGDVLDCYQGLLVSGDTILESQLRTFTVDAWYLDGFAPSKNPAMWRDAFFSVMALLSSKKTTLSTFTAASRVNHGLQKVGFNTRKIPGHGQKRESITGVFNTVSDSIKTKRKTPWHAFSRSIPVSNKAIILGAGLAGCFLANTLAVRGWDITLIDQQDMPGKGASGNTRGVIFPMFSAYDTPLSCFMLHAFLFAANTYKSILSDSRIGELTGILQLAGNVKIEKMHMAMGSWLKAYPELACVVTSDEASELAGLLVADNGLYIPQAGWVDSPALCRKLIGHPRIKYIASTTVSDIHFKNKTWYAAEHTAPVLIIANGYQAAQFQQTQHLPLHAVRGQMTGVCATEKSKKLRLPLCGMGHILPAQDGVHFCGATFDLDSVDVDASAQDDIANRRKVASLVKHDFMALDVSCHWAGIRGATPDYLPLVGAVSDSIRFQEIFSKFSLDAKAWVPQSNPIQQGLYVFSGFGSRGLTSIPFAAEYLASLINNEPVLMSRAMMQSISPARFLSKALACGGKNIAL